MKENITKNNLKNFSNGKYQSKKIISMSEYAYKNNEFLFKKADSPSSFEEKITPLNKYHKLKKGKTLKTINNINLNNKMKLLNSNSINKGSNKCLFNYANTNSLNKKEFNNSLSNLRKKNLKKNIYLFKDKKGKNNLNTFSNIINYKKISIPLRKNILQKKKLSFKAKNYNRTEDMKINKYFNENNLSNSVGENDYNFRYSTLISDSNKRNKFNNIDNKSLKHYENQFKKYNSLTNETITKDQFYTLKNNFNMLLEENQLYKKKVHLLQKENKKLKEEIFSNKYNELISQKSDINKIKKLNAELEKQNKQLKKEVNNLKIKINELTEFNKRNSLNEKILEEIPLEYFESFFSFLIGLSIPSTERYIKKLEKENNDLSNELTKYKNLFLSKNN
jgi:hypothetical protein